MPKDIYLKLKSPTPFLSAIGFLYKDPPPATDPDDAHGVAIRNTIGAEFHLAPGKYVFRFLVKNGGGEFTIRATKAKDDKDVSKDYDTAKDGYGPMAFDFEVTK